MWARMWKTLAAAEEACKAEFRSLREPRVGVNRKGSLSVSSAGGVSGNTGIRIVPAERFGSGQRRGHPGVVHCSTCGERHGWMA